MATLTMTAMWMGAIFYCGSGNGPAHRRCKPCRSQAGWRYVC
jgi:hypothetical protein